MRRIKSVRAQFYSCEADSPDFQFATVVEANDLRLMRAVVRAADEQGANSRASLSGNLRDALDAFNKGARK